MIDVIDKLPEHVTMSKHFEDKVKGRREGKRKFKYLRVLHGGKAFYIPITRQVWEAFSLSTQLRNQDGEVCWESRVIEGALSDIVGAIMLQVRDDILGGLGREILADVHKRIDMAMGQPLMREIYAKADERMGKLLEPPADVIDVEVGK